MNLAERANEEVDGPGQASWLAKLKEEHDNLRTALRGALDTGETETGVRLAAALDTF